MRTWLLIPVLMMIAVPASGASAPTAIVHFPDLVAKPPPPAVEPANGMVLQAELVNIQLAGTVARMEVKQTYRYDSSWSSPGEEAVSHQRTSHLSALHDYWITEAGAIHRGIVRDQRSAVAEYQANLAQKRDPGLVEWIDEGLYRISLYPVPKNGGTKDQGYILDQVLPISHEGRVRLRYDLPPYPVESSRWILDFGGRPPRSLSSNVALVELPGRPGVFSGELRRVEGANSQVWIEWDLDAESGPLRWLDASGKRFLEVERAEVDPDGSQRERFLATLGPLPSLPRPPRNPDQEVRIPEEWLTSLEGSARAITLELDEKRALDAMLASRSASIVGPGVVLFANPFATAEGIEAGWKAATEEAARKEVASLSDPPAPGKVVTSVPAPPPSSPAGSVTPARTSSGGSPGFRFSLEIPSIFVPTFKRARERANTRACFANQKTMAGAIEMWNLDNNCLSSVHLARGEPIVDPNPTGYREERLVHSEPYALPRVTAPPGLQVSYWRRGIKQRVEIQRIPVHSTQTCTRDHTPGARPAPLVAVGPLARTLVDAGYLQSYPTDPGGGSDENYYLTEFGNGIICILHGDIQSGGRLAPRDILVQAGIQDPRILGLASSYLPPTAQSRQNDALMTFALIYVLLAGLGWAIFLGTQWRECRADLVQLLPGQVWSAIKWLIGTFFVAGFGGPLGIFPWMFAAMYAGLVLASISLILTKTK